MDNLKIAVIIVSFNGEKFLSNCLNSLYRQDYKNFEIIVVDNNSSDQTANLVKKEFPKVHLILNEKNEGYAKANNQGIKIALKTGAEYIALLNQDTKVESNFLSSVGKSLSEREIGLAGPKIKYFNTNKIWWAGTKIYNSLELLYKPTIKISEHLGKREEDRGQYDQKRDIDGATGCALFLKKELIKKIGLFDERFFMYGEDIDLSIEARKAGYKIRYFPETTVFHLIPLSDISNPALKFLFFKYKNYFKGLLRLVGKHLNFFQKIIWFVKLPLAVLVSLIYQISLRLKKSGK